MTLYEAIVAEHAAWDEVAARINKGVLPTDPKVPVLKLIQQYRAAVERRVLTEIRDRILERIPV